MDNARAMHRRRGRDRAVNDLHARGLVNGGLADGTGVGRDHEVAGLRVGVGCACRRAERGQRRAVAEIPGVLQWEAGLVRHAEIEVHAGVNQRRRALLDIGRERGDGRAGGEPHDDGFAGAGVARVIAHSVRGEDDFVGRVRFQQLVGDEVHNAMHGTVAAGNGRSANLPYDQRAGVQRGGLDEVREAEADARSHVHVRRAVRRRREVDQRRAGVLLRVVDADHQLARVGVIGGDGDQVAKRSAKRVIVHEAGVHARGERGGVAGQPPLGRAGIVADEDVLVLAEAVFGIHQHIEAGSGRERGRDDVGRVREIMPLQWLAAAIEARTIDEPLIAQRAAEAADLLRVRRVADVEDERLERGLHRRGAEDEEIPDRDAGAQGEVRQLRTREMFDADWIGEISRVHNLQTTRTGWCKDETRTLPRGSEGIDIVI